MSTSWFCYVFFWVTTTTKTVGLVNTHVCWWILNYYVTFYTSTCLHVSNILYVHYCAFDPKSIKNRHNLARPFSLCMPWQSELILFSLLRKWKKGYVSNFSLKVDRSHHKNIYFNWFLFDSWFLMKNAILRNTCSLFQFQFLNFCLDSLVLTSSNV